MIESIPSDRLAPACAAALPPVVCPACGHTNVGARPWTVPSTRSLLPWVRCLACRCFFLDEMYDMKAEVSHTGGTGWGGLASGIEYNARKDRLFRTVLRRLAAFAPPPRTLVDIGCAYGGMLFAARRAGYAAYGTDILPVAVEWLRAQGIAAEVASSIASAGGAIPAQVDSICCLDCNYYWPDQPAELNGIYAKLKPGGIVVFRVASKAWLFALGLILSKCHARAGMRVCRAAVNDHRFTMPLRSFLGEVKRAGFDIRAVSPWDAIHSGQTNLPVKLSFAVGTVLWKLFRCNFTPGALITAQRPAP